jgi:hypothetical protein
MVTSMVSGLSVLMISLATAASAVFLIAAAVLIGEFGIAIYNIAQLSLRQTVTPAPWLGRMNATVRFLMWGAMPLGGLAGGALGSLLGIRPTLWVCATGMMLAALPLLAPAVRRAPQETPAAKSR